MDERVECLAERRRAVHGNLLETSVAELASPGIKKFKAAARLIAISEKDPAALSPFFDGFSRLLKSENSIVKWSAQRILANLACVGGRGRLARILEEYLAPIRGPVMITAVNAILGGAKIAAAQRELAPRIASAILGVEKARYKTPGCRNVAIGHAIAAFGAMGEEVRRSKRVIAFVKRQAKTAAPALERKRKRSSGRSVDPCSARGAEPTAGATSECLMGQWSRIHNGWSRVSIASGGGLAVCPHVSYTVWD